MLKPAIAWIAAFLFSALLTRTSVSSWTNWLLIPFPNYDGEAINTRVKGRALDRLWLAVAIVCSSLIAAAMAVRNEMLMIALLFPGVLLMIGFSYVRGYRLFHAALVEMGLPWPPAALRTDR
ncbi:MAG: hypothetical protein ABIS14_01485 [Sphingomonas sp.]